jgi:hypothetical protein
MLQQGNERTHFHINRGLRRLAETLHLKFHQVVLGYILQPHVEHLSPPLQKISSGIIPKSCSFFDGHRLRHIHHVRDRVLPSTTEAFSALLLLLSVQAGGNPSLECKGILNANQVFSPAAIPQIRWPALAGCWASASLPAFDPAKRG